MKRNCRKSTTISPKPNETKRRTTTGCWGAWTSWKIDFGCKKIAHGGTTFYSEASKMLKVKHGRNHRARSWTSELSSSCWTQKIHPNLIGCTVLAYSAKVSAGRL